MLSKGDDRPGRPIAVRELLARRSQVEGISRRSLLRRSLATGVAMWLVTVGAVALRGLWPTGARASARIRVGTLDEIIAANPGLPVGDGFPAYVAAAHAFVMLIDPTHQAFVPGVDETGDGRALNVRALSQVCPHLGCRPNPCIDDFWMHCPCHQSRYDRLGIKIAGTAFGPAPRSMDRYAIEVGPDGVLTIDTRTVTLGPPPVALGSAGVIAPRVPSGCG